MSPFAQTRPQKERESEFPDPRAPVDMPVVRITQEAEPKRHAFMAKVQTDRDLRSNRLLGALEPDSRRRLDPHLEPVDFKLGDMVCDAGGLLKHAYLPQGSVLRKSGCAAGS